MEYVLNVVHIKEGVVLLVSSKRLYVKLDLPDLPDAAETVVHGGHTGLKVFI